MGILEDKNLLIAGDMFMQPDYLGEIHYISPDQVKAISVGTNLAMTETALYSLSDFTKYKEARGENLQFIDKNGLIYALDYLGRKLYYCNVNTTWGY